MEEGEIENGRDGTGHGMGKGKEEGEGKGRGATAPNFNSWRRHWYEFTETARNKQQPLTQSSAIARIRWVKSNYKGMVKLSEPRVYIA